MFNYLYYIVLFLYFSDNDIQYCVLILSLQQYCNKIFFIYSTNTLTTTIQHHFRVISIDKKPYAIWDEQDKYIFKKNQYLLYILLTD